jgi:hypothetical protein
VAADGRSAAAVTAMAVAVLGMRGGRTEDVERPRAGDFVRGVVVGSERSACGGPAATVGRRAVRGGGRPGRGDATERVRGAAGAAVVSWLRGLRTGERLRSTRGGALLASRAFRDDGAGDVCNGEGQINLPVVGPKYAEARRSSTEWRVDGSTSNIAPMICRRSGEQRSGKGAHCPPTTRAMRAGYVLPTKGRSSATHSYAMQPTAHTSDFPSYGRFSNSSGAM